MKIFPILIIALTLFSCSRLKNKNSENSKTPKGQISFKTIILNDEEFKKLSASIFKPMKYDSESELDTYREETQRMQDTIILMLSRKWQEVKDWEVGTAWNTYDKYYNCGGIYSERIFCREYIETIMDAIDQSKEPKRTYYHTACEINTDRQDGEYWGEFYITKGKLYILNSMTKDHIQKLTK